MTKQEIMELEDRELDVAVAEARGWEVTVLLWYNCMGEQRVRYYNSFSGCPIPYFSTAISVAWPLLNEVTQAGYGWSMMSYEGGALVEITFEARGVALMTADTAPEAICKAFLLWRETRDE